MKLLDKTLQFEKEYTNAQKTRYLKALDPYVRYMPILAMAREGGTVSKHLLLALTASMEGIIVGKSQLGLFSPDLEKMATLVARGLIRCLGKESELEERLLAKLVLGGLVTMTGLLWLAYDQTTQHATEYRPKRGELFVELLLRAFFSSELPKTTFKTMAETVGADTMGSKMVAESLESLALLFAILAFAQNSGEYDTELIEGLRPRLLKNFENIEMTLSDLVRAEKITREAAQPVRLFIGQGRKTLENRNFEPFIKGLNEMTHPYGISIAKLQEDIQTSRRLFAALGTNFSLAAQAKDNVITFAG